VLSDIDFLEEVTTNVVIYCISSVATVWYSVKVSTGKGAGRGLPGRIVTSESATTSVLDPDPDSNAGSVPKLLPIRIRNYFEGIDLFLCQIIYFKTTRVVMILSHFFITEIMKLV
jgi:hypothetical protein